MRGVGVPLLILVLALGGCVHPAPPMSWQRMDGQPVDPVAFQPAYLQCRGDAYAAATNAPAAAMPNIYLLAAAEGNRDQTREAVMQGCMSKSGYVFAPAPGSH
jgi:hypothetical protein